MQKKMAFPVALFFGLVTSTQGIGLYTFESVCFENQTDATIINTDPMTETNTTAVVFSLQSCANASIFLTENETIKRPSMEIMLQRRTTSTDIYIKQCNQVQCDLPIFKASTPDLQMCTSSQLFWISWNGTTSTSISFGHGEIIQDNTIFHYENYLHFDIDFIGIKPINKDNRWKFKIGQSTIQLKNKVRCNLTSETFYNTTNINEDKMPVTDEIIYHNTNIINENMIAVTDDTDYNTTNNSTTRISNVTDKTSTFDMQVQDENRFYQIGHYPITDKSHLVTTNEPREQKKSTFTPVTATINDVSTMPTDDKATHKSGTNGLNHASTVETIATEHKQQSTFSTTHYVTNSQEACFCECSEHTNPWAYLINLNLTVEELRLEMKEHLQRLTKALSVNRKETTRYLASKISARDERVSSQSIGLVGTLSIALVPAIIVFTDVLNCVRRARAITNLQNA